MAEPLPVPDEPAVLRRLLQVLMSPPPATPAWERLAPSARFGLRASYFLLDVDAGGDAETFLTYLLDRLLRRLDRRTEDRAVEARDRLRGPIVWPATLAARSCRDYDPTRFICRERRNEFDTPENQLLKFVLERVAECAQAVPAALRWGVCYVPTRGGAGPLPTAERLRRMEAALAGLRHHARLAAVTLPPRLDEVHLLRAETSRTEEYGAVAHVYRRYRAVVEATSWAAGVVASGKRVLPLPGQVTPDSDVWIEIGVAVLRAQGAQGPDNDRGLAEPALTRGETGH